MIPIYTNRLWIIMSLLFLLSFCGITDRAQAAPDQAETPGQIMDKDKQEDIESASRLSDKVIPMEIENLPRRPKPLLELGDPFLNTGRLMRGFKLPTGAVWQPSLIVWGNYRTALQSIQQNAGQVSEWANRFDVFGSLNLTFTERIVIGFRPVDREGRFSGYTFSEPGMTENQEGQFENEFNFNLCSLFFEGDVGELFPFLDRDDYKRFDLGVAVGRQLILIQEGMLINDHLDAVGLSKINMKAKGMINFRTTLLWSWNELNRQNLAIRDGSASLVGWFNEIDFRRSTMAWDMVYVRANDFSGDGIYGGIGATQRMGRINSTFRILGSWPLGVETNHNKAGFLFFNALSWTPRSNHNLIYFNSFIGIQQFRSASRGPMMGGPLGRVGILYASTGLGRYGSALNNNADDAFGGALGYQMFFDNNRKQILLEFGSRYMTNDMSRRAFAAGASYQMAVGRRNIVRIDGFTMLNQNPLRSPRTDTTYGGRLELVYKM